MSEVIDSNPTTERLPRPVESEEERAERLAKQEEIDSRSIYVGNVDYTSTPEQLESFFNKAGIIERITILFDKYSGAPKGYAYVEFDTKEGVSKAIVELHGKEFRGRELRVTPKRTNLPGFRVRGGTRGRGPRGRARGRGRGGRGGRGNRGWSSGNNGGDSNTNVDTSLDN